MRPNIPGFSDPSWLDEAARFDDEVEDCFQAQLESFPYVTPWTALDVERTAGAMGANPYAHGLDGNRATMEQFCDQAYRLGLTKTRITVDDYFREYLAS